MEKKREREAHIKINNRYTLYEKYLNVENYIDLLNKYQSYFNFDDYELIPNYYGNFKKLKNLEDYNEIPNDIIDGIKIVFNEDLYSCSIYKGIQINGIIKKTLSDIGKIIGECFEEMIKNDRQLFNYENTYYLCKIIIKYIPKKNNREKQIKLYNLCKILDKNILPSIEIDYDDTLLYNDINKGIIQYINKSISNYGYIDEAKRYINDIYKLINENSDILDPINYSIIPNQLGIFTKITELKKGNKLIPELIDIISKETIIK